MTDEELKALRKQFGLSDGRPIEIGEATPKTPLLALLQLIIVQCHLLELNKAEGGNGRASQAFEHVQKAVDLLSEYEIQPLH